MTKENTYSLLQSIKNKMQKINTPKTKEQPGFINLDDEFEYISSSNSKLEAPVSSNKANNEVNNNPTHENINAASVSQKTTPLNNLPDFNQDLPDLDKNKTLVDDNFVNKGSELSNLTLPDDLKASFATMKESEVAEVDNDFELNDLENIADEVDFDIETNNKQEVTGKKENPTVKNDLIKDQDLDDLELPNDDFLNDSQQDDIPNLNKQKEIEDDLDLDDFELDDDLDDKQSKEPNFTNKQPIIEPNVEEHNELEDLDLQQKNSQKLFEEDEEQENILEESDTDSQAPNQAINIQLDSVQKEDIVDNIQKNNDLTDLEEEDDFDWSNIEDEDHEISSKHENNKALDLNLADHKNKINEKQNNDLALDIEKEAEDQSNINKIPDIENNLAETNSKKESPTLSNNNLSETIKDSLLSSKTIETSTNLIKKFMDDFNPQESPVNKSLSSLSNITVEQMIVSMLEPKLEEWLNRNLPFVVEKVIREEISKIIPKK